MDPMLVKVIIYYFKIEFNVLNSKRDLSLPLIKDSS